MFKVINIQLTEQIVEKIVNEFNSMVPKGCDKIKIFKNWHTGFEINLTHYNPPIKKICIWKQNYLLSNGHHQLSYSDTIMLYLCFQNVLGKDKVKFI
jgi:hypothetical protein